VLENGRRSQVLLTSALSPIMIRPTWTDIGRHFTFDTNNDELKERIREWTMKKMATLFHSWKKNLYTKFVKKNVMPIFSTKAYVKLRPFWDEFVQYKTSKQSEAIIRRNKENAAKKKYHHHLGSCGYMSAIPKWERMEREMMARGVVPQTIRENWGEHSKQSLYGRGGTVDPVTGLLDWGPEISRAAERLVHARVDVASGLLTPFLGTRP